MHSQSLRNHDRSSVEILGLLDMGTGERIGRDR